VIRERYSSVRQVLVDARAWHAARAELAAPEVEPAAREAKLTARAAELVAREAEPRGARH